MSGPSAQLRPERILELSDRLTSVASQKIEEIATVNRAAKMLAINALIEAARAGDAGRGFAIVAEAFKSISMEIDVVAASLETEVGSDLKELSLIGDAIMSQMRGQRLADLSLNAIDIIDRNLFERTCDVRWWATDSAIVACVATKEEVQARFAGERLGVILDAYTVYLDLWVCDTDGRIVATGRPKRYPATKGAMVADQSWFKDAMGTASGDDFAVCDVQRETLLGHAPVATYAAAIREGGRSDGKIIGVLGIHFDWESQAQAVVDGVRLNDEERGRSRVMLLDQNYRILASTQDDKVLDKTFPIDTERGPMSCYTQGDVTIGYARTPGYETYKGLGWYGCVAQTKAKT